MQLAIHVTYKGFSLTTHYLELNVGHIFRGIFLKCFLITWKLIKSFIIIYNLSSGGVLKKEQNKAINESFSLLCSNCPWTFSNQQNTHKSPKLYHNFNTDFKAIGKVLVFKVFWFLFFIIKINILKFFFWYKKKWILKESSFISSSSISIIAFLFFLLLWYPSVFDFQ